MLAKDLMIGDWVCSSINDINVRIAPAELNWDKAHTEWLANSKPIPLTAEILEKNGFKHRIIDCAEFYYIAEDYYDITISEWSDSIWLVRYDCTEMNTPHEQKICGYVHQLQHFLKECGLTELADNFKV